jgi:hypothetical protein
LELFRIGEINFKNFGESIYLIKIKLGVSHKYLSDGILEIGKIERGEISPYIYYTKN